MGAGGGTGTGAANLYRRGRTWWGRVQVGGAERRRSLRTDDRREALRRLAEWLERERARRWDGRPRRTWADAVGTWLRDVAPGALRPATIQRYAVSFRAVAPVLDGRDLDRIGRPELNLIAARPGASNATRRRDLTAVSVVLRAAVAWGWIDTNPAAAFDRGLIRERREPHRPPERAEIDALIARCPPNLARLLRFLAETGCRAQEACTLRWRQVDREGGTVTIYRTKTGRARAIRLASPGGDAVGTIVGTAAAAPTDPVFPAPHRGCYANLASRVAELVKGRGHGRRPEKRLTDLGFRCHDLRHAFAVRWLRAGGDLYALSRHLGHASVTTTERFYLAYVPAPGTKAGTGATVSEMGNAE